MINPHQHGLRPEVSKDQGSRQEFVAALRSHVLGHMAEHMRDHYFQRIESGRAEFAPSTGGEVHEAMQSDSYFRFYSAVRVNAQEMVFRSVVPVIDGQLESLNEQAAELREGTGADPVLAEGFEVPRNVTAIDVHLSPGSYHTEYAENDVAAGAVYDNSINVFSFNQMGRNIDDIGHTMANYTRLKFPRLEPGRILDCGCTVGHNTVPWKQAFPQAEVTGIDVSAPLLRYAAARSASFGADVRFAQMNATELDFPDNHFDVVFSSMFLHELPLKDIRKYLAEAHRVLRPGGLLLTMELPPNANLEPYEQFYLDWDCYYNNEPYYKAFRDQDCAELCAGAGFDKANFFEFQAPRYTYMPEDEWLRHLEDGSGYDDHSGTLTDGLRWYAFGCWKQ